MSKKFDDPIVEEVHQIRAKLLEKYGGAEGYAQHLKELESTLGDRVVSRKPKRPIKTHRKVS